MHIDIIPNRGSRPAVLLRETYRENGAIKKRMIANLSSLPMDQIESIRAVLRGDKLLAADGLFERIESHEDGAVRAVMTTMRRLGFDKLLAPKTCRERDLVMAMVASRIIEPHTKLASTRWFDNTTLPYRLELGEITEDDLYESMDWLLERQPDIERKLAKRHLKEAGLLLYDLTSSYFEGITCPLAARGHNRDQKKGKLQVNYGIATDKDGRPVAVSVYKGNTNDAATVLDPLNNIRNLTGIKRVVMVGDRGMITQTAIDTYQREGGTDWITALRSVSIAKLVSGGAIQLGLFDDRNLFEIEHPDYPDERLVACRNPKLAKLRAHKREDLLVATERDLADVKAKVENRKFRGKKIRGKAKIGVAVGRIVNRHKVAKHFILDIRDDSFTWQRDETRIDDEARLDGIYVVRTSLPQERMSMEDVVRSYKSLANVERVFRTMKTVDLKVRPIHHRLEQRVRAHIFLCMLAYYIEWHMVQAWRELLMADEDQARKATRDPVAPADRSTAALKKVAVRTLENGEPVHSFATLIERLSALVRNTCRRRDAAPDDAVVYLYTTPDATQAKALELLELVAM